MKIGDRLTRTSKFKLKDEASIDTNKTNQNFSNLMQQEQKNHSEKLLKEILATIDDQGKKLAKSKNLRELKIYKELIKKFVDEAVHLSLQLENKFSYDRHGRSKRYKIIHELDEKIAELTDSTFKKEENQLKILEQIGEIRGLLVNLYS